MPAWTLGSIALTIDAFKIAAQMLGAMDTCIVVTASLLSDLLNVTVPHTNGERKKGKFAGNSTLDNSVRSWDQPVLHLQDVSHAQNVPIQVGVTNQTKGKKDLHKVSGLEHANVHGPAMRPDH
ncbi:hypothetical protein BDV93DRAFT_512788 [Ceratobasidium sp. AG-I]|nr:hypothetical protein BDV93DRAFT_512788 [Ceratobasidium sp. AG-I]